MKWEYFIIAVLVIVINLVILYLIGERSWGKDLNHRTRAAFWLYLKINRIRFCMKKNNKDLKKVIMLHLMKVSDEITNPNMNYNKAKSIFEDTTVFGLIDIFDDQRGRRYLMIDLKKYGGKYVFEIMEYIRIAYNQEIKEKEIDRTPGNKPEIKKELQTKPTLKLVK